MKRSIGLLLALTLATAARADISLDVKCVKLGPTQVKVSDTQALNFNQAVLRTKDGKQFVVLSAIPADTVKLGESYTVTVDSKVGGIAVSFMGGTDQTQAPRVARGVTKTAQVVEAYGIFLVGTDKDKPWKVNINGLDSEDVAALSQKGKYFLHLE